MNRRLQQKQQAHDDVPSSALFHSPPSPIHPLLALQRTAGNHAVATLLRQAHHIYEGEPVGPDRNTVQWARGSPPGLGTSPGTRTPIQPKLAVGPAGDDYEREADRVAEQVMRAPAVKCGDGAHGFCPTPGAQAAIQSHSAAGGFEVSDELESFLDTTRGSGAPLPGAVLGFMQERMGADFNEVRLHTGSPAAELNRALGAQAFTRGHDIYWGVEANLESNQGKTLLAHELAHVLQQRRGRGHDAGHSVNVHAATGARIARQALPSAGGTFADMIVPLLLKRRKGEALSEREKRDLMTTISAMTDEDFADLMAILQRIPDVNEPPWSTVLPVAGTALTGLLGAASRNTLLRGALPEGVAGAKRVVDAASLLGGFPEENLLRELLNALDPSRAQLLVDSVTATVVVPAIGFASVGAANQVTEANIKKRYQEANTTLKPYRIRIEMPSCRIFSPLDKMRFVDSQGNASNRALMEVLGNEKGTFDMKRHLKEKLAPDEEGYGATTDSLIDQYHLPGTITSFWFNDLTEGTTASTSETHGVTVDAKTRDKYAGKETLFLSIIRDDILAHELGHALGGLTPHGMHVTAGGQESWGDAQNIMYYRNTRGRTVLTPEQVQAFKSGLYALLSR